MIFFNQSYRCFADTGHRPGWWSVRVGHINLLEVYGQGIKQLISVDGATLIGIPLLSGLPSTT